MTLRMFIFQLYIYIYWHVFLSTTGSSYLSTNNSSSLRRKSYLKQALVSELSWKNRAVKAKDDLYPNRMNNLVQRDSVLTRYSCAGTNLTTLAYFNTRNEQAFGISASTVLEFYKYLLPLNNGNVWTVEMKVTIRKSMFRC